MLLYINGMSCTGPFLENFLGGVGLAFAGKNGCERLHMGIAGKNRRALYNETLVIWLNMIVYDWRGRKEQARKQLNWI